MPPNARNMRMVSSHLFPILIPVTLELAVDKSWGSTKRPLVTTELLGKALTPNQSFENPDGTPVRITTDYFDKPRDSNNPFPGPFEITQDGTQSIKVWPK